MAAPSVIAMPGAVGAEAVVRWQRCRGRKYIAIRESESDSDSIVIATAELEEVATTAVLV